MRGEKSRSSCAMGITSGSPPRARGKGIPSKWVRNAVGITPACAGKRTPFLSQSALNRDHPRVRGEKTTRFSTMLVSSGSPPRARGKADYVLRQGAGRGITPACAGKSIQKPLSITDGGDHPRVRGEKRTCSIWLRTTTGSPPRARGKDSHPQYAQCPRGITPACAGKRLPRRGERPRLGDHPRVRGEKATTRMVLVVLRGSPPRARGKDSYASGHRRRSGITPACAGKSPDHQSWQ